MKKIIFVCTHGRFGEELIKSAQMIVGNIEYVYSFSLLDGMSPEEYTDLIKQKLTEIGGREVICIADLFGGTPCICASGLMNEFDISVITGLNLAMLIEMLSQREFLSKNELIDCGLNTLKESGLDISTYMKSNNRKG